MMPRIYAPAGFVNGTAANNLTIKASLLMPWRLAHIDGLALSGPVTCTMDGHEPDIEVFTGLVDTPDAHVRGLGVATARGLPEWRQVVGPQTFQDVRLETLLEWLAGRCGGRADLQVRGSLRRHYVMRQGPAWQLAREALTHWGSDALLSELDAGVLFIGPERLSPHAQAGSQFRAAHAENVHTFEVMGDGYRLTLPLTPHLRPSHRGEIDHPLYTGAARITALTHTAGPRNHTRLEVIPT